MSKSRDAILPDGSGQPAWAVAALFPAQGQWEDFEYLDLSRRTNRFVELLDGCIDVLDWPTKTHQKILAALLRRIEDFVRPRSLGDIIAGPYPLRLGRRHFREPDLTLVLAEHAEWFGEQFAAGADLVVEIVGEDRELDLETKRREYAEDSIPEYWIVDPRDRRITVLRLEDGAYVSAGEYDDGQHARSVILPEFEIDVTATLDAR